MPPPSPNLSMNVVKLSPALVRPPVTVNPVNVADAPKTLNTRLLSSRKSSAAPTTPPKLADTSVMSVPATVTSSPLASAVMTSSPPAVEPSIERSSVITSSPSVRRINASPSKASPAPLANSIAPISMLKFATVTASRKLVTPSVLSTTSEVVVTKIVSKPTEPALTESIRRASRFSKAKALACRLLRLLRLEERLKPIGLCLISKVLGSESLCKTDCDDNKFITQVN